MKEQGHSVFHLLILLPILLGFGGLAIALSSLSSERNSHQNEIDRIALTSAQYLPSKESKRIAEELLSKLHLEGHKFSVMLSERGNAIAINSVAHASTRTILAKTSNWQLSAHAKAQLSPVDVALILPDGASMKPALDSPWGDNHTWGASSYLTSCAAPPKVRYINSEVLYLKSWHSDLGRRWLTQGCFNPLFSSIKLLGMSIAEETLSIGSNRLAVIFSPGRNSPEAVRQINGELEIEETLYFPGQVGGFNSPLQVPVAKQTLRSQTASRLGDHLCVFLADPRFSYGLERYQGSSALPLNCEDAVISPRCGEPYDPALGLNESCIPSIAEAIYWRAAGDSNSNLASGIERGVAELLTSGDERYERAVFKVRGNLGIKPEKVLLLITDELPEIQTSIPILTTALKSEIRFILIVVGRANYPTAQPTTNHSREWSDFFAGYPESKLLTVETPEQLSSEAAPFILKQLRRVVLQS